MTIVSQLEARKFVREHAQRIIHDPSSATESEVEQLARVAVRLRDLLDATEESLRLTIDEGIPAW